MARELPILPVWSQSSDTAVSTQIILHHALSNMFISVLMQWAEGGRSVWPLLTCADHAQHFSSLDDFIDVRLGRPTRHIHVNPLSRFSTRGPSLSSEPGTPTSIVPPALSRQSEDDEETVTPDIHSRSARIRAFRMFQKSSPDEKERMLRQIAEGNGVRHSGPSWKAVHLFSAEEVESLFTDVVEGLAFLVRSHLV